MTRRDEIAAAVRALLGEQRVAVLATHADGQPYASLVAFAATDDLDGLVFATTRATRKYANLHADARIAMLVDSRSPDDLDFHGSAALTTFVAAPTTALLRLDVETYYLVHRFQEVVELHVREG